VPDGGFYAFIAWAMGEALGGELLILVGFSIVLTLRRIISHGRRRIE
jgi:hypothetical protein